MKTVLLLVTLAALSTEAAEQISEGSLYKTLAEYCDKNKKDFLVAQSRTCKIARESAGLFDLCKGDSKNDSRSKMFLDEIAMSYARATNREESEVRPLICAQWIADNQAVEKPTCDSETKNAKAITRKWWDGESWAATTEAASGVEAKAEKGDPRAIFNVGFWYMSGEPCFKQDEARAVQFFCRAYDKGFQMAAVQLQSIAKNHGVPADQARDLLGRRFGCILTAEQAEQDADIKKQQELAARLLKKAEGGDVNAMAKIATYYQTDSDGLKQDDKKAFAWAEKAAKKGNVEAMSLLGSFYNRGIGTEADDKKAFEWNLKAAQAGDTDSAYFVGLCYYDGQGIETNLSKAVQWLSTAMNGGSTDAKEKLVEMHLKGELNAVTYKSLSDRLKKLEKEK